MIKNRWLFLLLTLFASLLLTLLVLSAPALANLAMPNLLVREASLVEMYIEEKASNTNELAQVQVAMEEAWIVWETDAPVQSLLLISDTLWVGGYHNGLLQWDVDLGYQTQYTLPNGRDVVSLASLANGDLLATTLDGGIAQGNGQFTDLVPPLSGYGVWDVAVANDGSDFWLATWGDGVLQYDNGTWITHTTQTSQLPFDDVYAVAVDNNDFPWVGTLGYGVAHFDGSDWVSVTVPVSVTHPLTPTHLLSNQAVQDIVVDAAGQKWMATDGSGVAVLDASNTIWQVYDSSNSALPNDFVYAITLNGDDVWLGTLGGGVVRYDTVLDSWELFNSSNSPLPEDDVLAVAIDENGGQWLATYNVGLTYHGILPTIPPLQALDFAQAPEYIAGDEKSYYLWLDTETYIWHLAWSGDGQAHDFTGSIIANGDVDLVETIGFEGGDAATAISNTLTITATEALGDDLVRFTLDRTVTDLTINLLIDGAYRPFNIQLGTEGEMPSTAPFRLVPAQPIAPEVVINGSRTSSEGQSVYLTGMITDTDSMIGHEIRWQLADGTTVTDTLSVANIYNDNGFYDVTLTVTDVHGLVGQDVATIRVDNSSPDIYFYPYQYLPEANEIVTFVVNVYDPGIEDTHTYLWDFGDGITTTDAITGTHIYSAAGIYTVTLTVMDDDGGVGSFSDSLEVLPSNAAPVAVDDAVSTNEDTAVTIDVLANDSDADGDTLSVTNIISPSYGTAVLNVGGSITYTPTVNYYGDDSFVYTISDGRGKTSEASVTLTIASVNDIPLAIADAVGVDEDNAVVIPVLANDSDVDGDTLTVTAVTTPTNGIVAINLDSSLTYTPTTNIFGGDGFSYTVVDGQGGMATAAISVTVYPVNDAPQAVDDESATAEDTAVIVNVLANDNDVDGDALSVESVSAPAYGNVTINLDNTLTYTPAVNYIGSDLFNYTVNDGFGLTATATVTITISNENDNPVAVVDAVTTDEDTAVTIDVLANDSDVDGDALSIDTATQPTHGAVVINPDNTINYTPADNYYGVDSFNYTVRDGRGGAATAVVSVTVTAVNDAPFAVNDTATTNEDTSVVVAILDNDGDVDGEPLTMTVTLSPTLGSIQINPENSITYTPFADAFGNDSLTYTISDGAGASATAVVSITVIPVNDIPLVLNDTAQTDEDTVVVVPVLDNDSDVDGDSLLVTNITQPSSGSAAINLDQTITYTPILNTNGTDTFTYGVSDGQGGVVSATVAITINPINDAPIAANDVATTDTGVSVTIPVLDNDTDVELDTLTVTSVTAPSDGTAVINPDNTITYTPNPNVSGNDSFTYTISDGNGGSDVATVSVTITATNTPTPTSTYTPTPTPTFTATPTPTGSDNKCQIFYDLDSWSNGFVVQMYLVNLQTTPIEGYTLSWDFAGDEQIVDSWNATFVQSGQSVTASNPATHWNGTIQSGDNVKIGFEASYSSTGLPTNIILTTNTGTCPVEFMVAPPPTPTATSTPAPTSTPTITPTPIVGDNKCQLFYDLDSWSNGFIAEMYIVNWRPTPIEGYTLSWDFAGDEQIIDDWNATFVQSGQSVTASNAAAHWNGTIDPDGGSVKIGYEASYSSTGLPANITLATSSGNCPLEFVAGKPPKVTSLRLMDADNDTSITAFTPLEDGDTIDLGALSTQNLNIRAMVSGSTQSVLFTLDGAENYSWIENVAPYALFGDTSGDYYAWTPSVGTYTLTAVPYTQDSAQGVAGKSKTITFTVTGGVLPPLVTDLVLMNADSDTPIASLEDGDILDLTALPTQNLNIQALAAGSTESVHFTLDGAETYARIENTAPYALHGDISGDYGAWTPTAGTYTITAVPYKQDSAEGVQGSGITLTFTVVGN